MDFEVSPFLAYQCCNGKYNLLPHCGQLTCATVTLTADIVTGRLSISLLRLNIYLFHKAPVGHMAFPQLLLLVDGYRTTIIGKFVIRYFEKICV